MENNELEKRIDRLEEVLVNVVGYIEYNDLGGLQEYVAKILGIELKQK